MLFSFQGELAEESVINYSRNFTSHFSENHQHNTAFPIIFALQIVQKAALM